MNRESNGQFVLDLFCGAGGAAMGYYRAGYEVIGIDNQPQPRYPFRFEQMDWLEGLEKYAHIAAAIHASPPCQAYTPLRHIHGHSYPDLVDAVRSVLVASTQPYVIENVPGSPLRNPIVLCGQMFGLCVYRHRLFESSMHLAVPMHPAHTEPASGTRGKYHTARILTVAGHNFRTADGQQAMDIAWMLGYELAQAIPPAYTEWIARQI